MTYNVFSGTLNPTQSVSLCFHLCTSWYSYYCTPGIERVQALTDILRSVLCCQGNKTRAPIANSPSSAQLGGTSYHSSKFYLGPCSSVGMW